MRAWKESVVKTGLLLTQIKAVGGPAVFSGHSPPHLSLRTPVFIFIQLHHPERMHIKTVKVYQRVLC